jgi:hypothetical protein
MYEDIPGAYLNPDGLWVFPREEFASKIFDPDPGNHVVFGGPSQNGKTTLAFKLLEYCATPEVPAHVIVSKPRDPVTSRESKRLGYPIVREWPPPVSLSRLLKREKPSGYTLWPPFGDMTNDVPNASRITREYMDYTYTKGAEGEQCIMVLDDTYAKSVVLNLDREMVTLHAMAGAMGIGVWTFVQKPTGAGRTPLMAYGAAEYVFLFYDPDKKNRERYDEIGGFDPKEIERILMSLRKYQALCLKRDGRHVCIVDRK